MIFGLMKDSLHSECQYNSLSPLLTNIFHFGSLYIVISLTSLKNVSTREKFSHLYKQCFVALSN